MCFLPSCTMNVWPMNSGKMVERRDQVLIAFFSPLAFMDSTFAISLGSAYGPFFKERPIRFSGVEVWKFGSMEVVRYLHTPIPAHLHTVISLRVCGQCTSLSTCCFLSCNPARACPTGSPDPS